MKRSDLIAGASAGFLTAILTVVVLTNLAPAIGVWRWLLLIVLPVIEIFGLYIAKKLARFWLTFWQIAKYLIVGVLNTLVDFGVLNLLIYLTNIAAGFGFSVFKAISFIVAVINSFFWNKYWTFENKEAGLGSQFVKFFIVSTFVFFLNVLTATLVVNVIGPQGGIGAKIWANIGAAAASLVSFAGNFLGYKLLVFKARKPGHLGG